MTKTECRTATNAAIKSGAITKMVVCEKCTSSVAVECHHKDYSNPHDVEWLCYRCHLLAHGKTARKVMPIRRTKEYGTARTINLSKRHNEMLDSLKAKLDVSLSETVARALELLQEKETLREREMQAAQLSNPKEGTK